MHAPCWDGNASVSVVPKCLDASVQPCYLWSQELPLQVTVLSLGLPRETKGWNLVGPVLHQASEQVCYSWLTKLMKLGSDHEGADQNAHH